MTAAAADGVTHLALVGPTASGKSAVALAAAEALGDIEIVTVDSMQVYRGMDIGTAKPTAEEQAAAPHHLLDLADPGEEFSVARFQAAAGEAIAGIENRGRRALLVGGTGLYFHSVIDGYILPVEQPELRRQLMERAEEEGPPVLLAELAELDPVAAARIDPGNTRRIVRALEVTVGTGRPFSSYGPGVLTVHENRLPVRTVGLWLTRAEGARRIEARVSEMVGNGLIDEVRRLAGAPGGLSRTAREGIGYKEVLDHLEGSVPTLEAALRRTAERTRQLARRQRMWFRRDRRITWIGSGGNPLATLPALLATWNLQCSLGSSVNTFHFSKLHATGNDFLVLVDLEARLGSRGRNRLAPGLRAALCDRRRGVGADGLIRLLGGSDGADCEMELTNADGGLAEISGNGLRCLAHVAAQLGLGADDRLVVDTAAGRREMTIRRRGEDGEVDYAEADMGLVMFTPEIIPVLADSPFDLEATVDGVTYRGDAAGVGNPHFVAFVDDPAAVPLDRHGPVLEHDARFPNRTNVEVVVPTAAGLRMRVWERGVGETASCGSGACAAAAVAHRRGLAPARMTVAVPGGDLVVDLQPTGETSMAVRLGGPVAHVFDVDVDLDRLADTVPLSGGVL